MYDRPFGVEIECGTPNYSGRHAAMRLLANNGLSRWSNRVGYDGTEIEIRSPVLRGTAGMRELKKVMNLLKDNGYYTTARDGMHCHFDARDLNESDMIRVIKSWDANKEIIHKFLGARFNNRYCRYDYNFEDMEKNAAGLWRYDGLKSKAIEPRSRLRTLEFRQHYGTLNFEEAQAWILLVQAFIKNVANRKNPMRTVTMDELFRMTRVYKVAQRQLASRRV